MVYRFNECNREVTIHRPNVSTPLSSAFIRGDLIATTRGYFIFSFIICPFFWRGVNKRYVVSRHHYDLKERGRSWYARPPNKGAGGNVDKWYSSLLMVFIASHRLKGEKSFCYIRKMWTSIAQKCVSHLWVTRKSWGVTKSRHLCCKH